MNYTNVISGLLLLLLLGWILSLTTGCTCVRYGEATYISLFQDKSLSVTLTDGTVLSYSTTSDPAVEAFRSGIAAGAALAARGAVAP